MRELVIDQDIKAQGKAEGIKEGEISLILRQLKCCIGTITAEDEIRIAILSVEQLEALGEALLDFSSRDDLINWLAAQKLLPYLSWLLSQLSKRGSPPSQMTGSYSRFLNSLHVIYSDYHFG